MFAPIKSISIFYTIDPSLRLLLVTILLTVANIHTNASNKFCSRLAKKQTTKWYN